jgi:hypothetical protein
MQSRVVEGYRADSIFVLMYSVTNLEFREIILVAGFGIVRIASNPVCNLRGGIKWPDPGSSTRR